MKYKKKKSARTVLMRMVSHGSAASLRARQKGSPRYDPYWFNFGYIAASESEASLIKKMEAKLEYALTQGRDLARLMSSRGAYVKGRSGHPYFLDQKKLRKKALRRLKRKGKI